MPAPPRTESVHLESCAFVRANFQVDPSHLHLNRQSAFIPQTYALIVSKGLSFRSDFMILFLFCILLVVDEYVSGFVLCCYFRDILSENCLRTIFPLARFYLEVSTQISIRSTQILHCALR